MADSRLTDKTLFAGTLNLADLIHIVDVSDLSQNPAGSSYKLNLSQLKNFVVPTLANVLATGRDVDATGTIKTFTSVASIDVNNRFLTESGGINVITWDSQELYDNIGNPALDWNARLLQNAWTIDGNFSPTTNNTRDLGTATEGWANLYMGSKIHFATDLELRTGGVEKMRLTTGGFLGLGTSTNTTYPFEIKANVGVGEMVTLNRDHATNEGALIRFQKQGVNGWTIGANAQNITGHEFAIHDHVAGSSPLYISGTSKTGFGNSLDPGLWQVGVRATDHRALVLTTFAAAQTCVVAFSHNNNTTDIRWTIGSDVTGAGGATHEFGIADIANGTTPFLINNSGFIGIGNVTSPTARLHVKGSGVGTEKAFLVEASDLTDKFEVLCNGNVGILAATFGTSAIGVLSMANGTAPSTSPVDVFQAYAKDWNGAGTATLHARNEEGHIFIYKKSPDYTVTNSIPDRTYDATGTTLSELSQVVAAIISDLQGNGLFGS